MRVFALSEYKPYLALLLIFIGFVGFFLALGDQGPTGWLFLWAYDHVTFFALMREPQKFVMLLALSYAVFFGWGVGHLASSNFRFREYEIWRWSQWSVLRCRWVTRRTSSMA